jgi:hypothetical protein
VSKRKFPGISDAKSKKGHFLIQDVKFEDQLSEVAKEVWKSLKNVTTNILGGNCKAEKCCEMVVDLVQSYKARFEILSLKVHFWTLT